VLLASPTGGGGWMNGYALVCGMEETLEVDWLDGWLVG
jgi:hypothetical protein